MAFSARVRDYLPWAPKLPGYLWVAVMLYLVLMLAVLEVPRFFVRRRVPDEGRRLLLARGTAVAAGLIAGSTVAFGAETALGPPVRVGAAPDVTLTELRSTA
ncbi:hypothetical protein [Catelliglobosispora koreensis]|uniref:hypothetical protein n=1 Tax=Catelliglobosispora koreensis TaxID=129052 RepID=UPI0003601B2D|nr:hypothetical protein [Catelliglobosispora koreensis]